MTPNPQPELNDAQRKPADPEKSPAESGSVSTSVAEERGVELEPTSHGDPAEKSTHTAGGAKGGQHAAPTAVTGELADQPSAGTDNAADSPPAEAQKYGWRFYAVYSGLVAATLLSALDGAIVATALPTIASTLDLGPNYVWVANIYFLTGAILQPLFGQLSDLWGRRWIFIGILAIFTLGSGLCGGASSGDMLIAARAVQGVGAGGINMMVDLIVCDLVPLRDRSKYLGFIFLIIGLFTAAGPLVGGALSQGGHWRWVFYLNLPIGAACMVVTFLFLNVKRRADHASFAAKMLRIDWGGVTLLTLSTVGVMYAVTYGGSERPWSDASVLGPLIAGLITLVLFVIYEGLPFVPEPVTPYHLFANITSAAAFAITFLHSIMGLWIMYVFAVYFQAVVGVSQTMSGVYLMPTVIGFPLAVAVGGGVMSKLGRYKPIHLVGFALLTLGSGLASILGPHSSPAAWVFFQLFMAVGTGLVMACLLPAVQARLNESDTALSTGTWAFIRSYGVIWGTTIPAAIFNNRFDELLWRIGDPAARAQLGHGQAYAHATKDLVNSFQGETRVQVRQVYSDSIQRVWQIAVIFGGASFLLALLEREVSLRKELETDFGLEDGKKEKSAQDAA